MDLDQPLQLWSCTKLDQPLALPHLRRSSSRAATRRLKSPWPLGNICFQIALQHNAPNTQLSRKIMRLTQLASEQEIAVDVENMDFNIDVGQNLVSLKTELFRLRSMDYGDA